MVETTALSLGCKRYDNLFVSMAHPFDPFQSLATDYVPRSRIIRYYLYQLSKIVGFAFREHSQQELMQSISKLGG